MAEPVTIARPYAEAAFRLACEQNALSAWSDALALINAVVADAQIAALIDAPNVGAAQLEGVIIGAVGKHLSGDAQFRAGAGAEPPPGTDCPDSRHVRSAAP
jgi:F-type H+-transporting ATPase subunit delta